MQITLKHQPSYALAVVQLAPNESIAAETGAMVSMNADIQVETSAKGGLLGGLKRAVSGESFFQNTYTASGNGGEITLAPTMPGDMRVLQIEGAGYLLQSGAYVASETSVEVDSKWGGAKGFFGGGGLVMLKCTGSGQLLANGYGAIEERTLGAGESYIVDNYHVMGFDAHIQYEVKRVGNWKSTILGGEGLVTQFTGPGRILLQTRSEGALLGWLIPKLPTNNS